jgi:transcriptional regulator with XRE-family HTH domain
MVATERLYDRGTRRGAAHLATIGEEYRHARTTRGLSQREVADASRIDRGMYSRIERAKLPYLSVVTAARLASVLGLDLWVRVFPGGKSIRDAGHADRLRRILACVAPPLKYRIEVPLPARSDRLDQRAWDAMLFGQGRRTAIEFESRLYDIQAQVRRFGLKARDDSPDSFLLVIADTPANRRVLRESAELLSDLPRLRTANVLKALRAGMHPPTGLMLLERPRVQADRSA